MESSLQAYPNQTAAHRIFAIHDLCVCIAECFRKQVDFAISLDELIALPDSEEFDLDADENRPTLINLALVCRAFREPALDALWSRLSGFAPLARLLFPLDDFNDRERAWELRDVPPQSLERFYIHARRIRYISFDDEDDAPPKLIELLGSLDGPVLPSIQVILWRASASPLVRSLHRFLSPTLSTFCMMCEDFEPDLLAEVSNIVASFPDTCPKLKLLNLYGDSRRCDRSYTAPIADSLNASLGKLPHLSEVVVAGFSITSRISTTLSSLAHLQRLFLELDSGLQPLPVWEFIPFPVLTTFIIQGLPRNCINFIESLRPIKPARPLARFVASFNPDDPTLDEQLDFARAVRTSFGETLQQIEVAEDRFDPAVLPVFFECRRLRSVRINFGLQRASMDDVRDSLLDRAIAAWPDLQVAKLSENDYETFYPQSKHQ